MKTLPPLRQRALRFLLEILQMLLMCLSRHPIDWRRPDRYCSRPPRCCSSNCCRWSVCCSTLKLDGRRGRTSVGSLSAYNTGHLVSVSVGHQAAAAEAVAAAAAAADRWCHRYVESCRRRCTLSRTYIVPMTQANGKTVVLTATFFSCQRRVVRPYTRLSAVTIAMYEWTSVRCFARQTGRWLWRGLVLDSVDLYVKSIHFLGLSLHDDCRNDGPNNRFEKILIRLTNGEMLTSSSSELHAISGSMKHYWQL